MVLPKENGVGGKYFFGRYYGVVHLWAGSLRYFFSHLKCREINNLKIRGR